MAIQASDDGNIKKNICIFSSPKNPTEQPLKHRLNSLKSLIEGTEDMQLHDKTEVSGGDQGWKATFYTIGNNRYSRKAFESIVKSDTNWQKHAD